MPEPIQVIRWTFTALALISAAFAVAGLGMLFRVLWDTRPRGD